MSIACQARRYPFVPSRPICLASLLLVAAALVAGCDDGEKHPASSSTRPSTPDASQVGARPAEEVTAPTPDKPLQPNPPVEAESAVAGLPVDTDDSGTADPVPAFIPLADAAKGEWTAYDALDGRSLRYEVIDTAVTTVRIRVQVFVHGKPLGEPAVRTEERGWDPMARRAEQASVKRRVGPAAIEAAGRAWDAMLYEEEWTDEEVRYARRTWVSPAVPVFGTIRMELHGDDRLEARLDLTGFGVAR